MEEDEGGGVGGLTEEEEERRVFILGSLIFCLVFETAFAPFIVGGCVTDEA